MGRDTFRIENPYESLLVAPSTGLKGVQSPEAVKKLEAVRVARVAAAARARERLAEPTNPSFAYDPKTSFFAHLAAGARVVSGWGAEIFDPEVTLTAC